MKYIYTGGPYREYRGYVFALGRPVSIDDKGTLEAISRDKDFQPFEEKHEEEKQEAAPQVLKRPVLSVRRK